MIPLHKRSHLLAQYTEQEQGSEKFNWQQVTFYYVDKEHGLMTENVACNLSRSHRMESVIQGEGTEWYLEYCNEKKARTVHSITQMHSTTELDAIKEPRQFLFSRAKETKKRITSKLRIWDEWHIRNGTVPFTVEITSTVLTSASFTVRN